MYKKSKAPWIRWDPSVFLSNTRGMNISDIGIYTYLGQHFYMRECPGLNHEDMVYLIKLVGSNELRLNKFKEKFPHFFVDGCFFCENLSASLELAKERKANSEKANKIKKEKQEAKKASDANDQDDQEVTQKEQELEKYIKQNKQVKRELEKNMIGSHIAKLTSKTINKSKGLNNSN